MLAIASACGRGSPGERGASPDAYCARTLELTGQQLPEVTREKIRIGCVVAAKKERDEQVDFYVCKSRCATAARDMGACIACSTGCEAKRKSAVAKP